MKYEEIINLYNESINKAIICLGIENIDIENNSDEARQVVCFVVKEMTDIFCARQINSISKEDCSEIFNSGEVQLVKILDVINMFV